MSVYFQREIMESGLKFVLCVSVRKWNSAVVAFVRGHCRVTSGVVLFFLQIINCWVKLRIFSNSNLPQTVSQSVHYMQIWMNGDKSSLTLWNRAFFGQLSWIKTWILMTEIMSEYKKTLLAFDRGMHSTECHSNYCEYGFFSRYAVANANEISTSIEGWGGTNHIFSSSNQFQVTSGSFPATGFSWYPLNSKTAVCVRRRVSVFFVCVS